MKNRWLLNIALVLLLGALVLVAVLRPGAKKDADSLALTTLAPESVERIRLQRPRQPDVVLVKADGTWQITAPRAARANDFRVTEIARMVAARLATRFPAVTADLPQYGLDKPLATVLLNDTEIRFGAMHPLNNQIYVLHDNRVQLIPAALLRTALTPLEELLSLGLLAEKTKITAMRFPAFRLGQNEQGAWTRTPEMKSLSSDRLNRFVDEWRYARALSVATYSGKPVKERITLIVADGAKSRSIEFGVLARKPELVIVRLDEKLEYHFPDDAVARLLDLAPDETPADKPAK
jgi:hypothetical protein